MKASIVSALSLLATAALAAPPFVLQPSGDRLAAPLEPSQQQHDIPELSVDDFLAVEHSITDSLKHSVAHLVDLASDDSDDSAATLPHPPHHPLPPPVLDFSDYTILEIVNATYKKPHHEPEHLTAGGFARKLRKGLGLAGDKGDDGEHHPSPEHLPLNHLAWLINFSPEAAALLEKDGASTFSSSSNPVLRRC